MRILQSMLTALVNAPVRMAALGWRQPPGIDTDPEAAVNAVLSATGEVSSLVYASTLLDQIEAMEDSELAALMTHIATRFDLNGDQLARAAAAYATSPALFRLLPPLHAGRAADLRRGGADRGHPAGYRFGP